MGDHFLFCTLFSSSNGVTDTIPVNRSLIDGETIVSSSGIFELGLFNYTSDRHYLGIWYTFSKETTVWVANRDVPLNDTSGVLQVTSQGILVMISSSNNVTVWSSGESSGSTSARNPIAQLLDTENFVVRQADDTNRDSYIWESFGFGYTSLAGSKIGKNLVTGLEWYRSSWKSPSDPSFGDATRRLETCGYPQFYNSVNGSVVFWSGPWNGFTFGRLSNLKLNPYFTYDYLHNEKEIYLAHKMVNSSVFSQIVLVNGEIVNQFLWNNRSRKWETYATTQRDDCDKYVLCVAFGRCSFGTNPSPVCNSPMIFTSLSKVMGIGELVRGCVRKNKLVCGADILSRG